MKKKILISLMVALLITALPMGMVYAEDTGQDSRSESMSVESGEEPIEDLAVTQDPGVAAGGEEEEADLIYENNTINNIISFLSSISWYMLAPAAGAVAFVILLIAFIAHMRKNRRKTAYVGKH